MKVVIYARVSTDDKDQNPERQIIACKSFAELHNYEVVGFFSDYCSGDSSPDSRIEFSKLLKFKPAGILVFEISRFSREHPSKVMRRLSDFKDKGIKLISITEPAFNMDGDFADLLQYIMSWFNNYYLTNLRRNVKSGLDRAKKNGKVLGRPLRDFNKFRAYQLIFIDRLSLRVVSKELGVPLATIFRFKKVCEKNPSSYIKDVVVSKSGVYETEKLRN